MTLAPRRLAGYQHIEGHRTAKGLSIAFAIFAIRLVSRVDNRLFGELGQFAFRYLQFIGCVDVCLRDRAVFNPAKQVMNLLLVVFEH
jgi:hypothetical protein